jgi:hypothetical protein
MGELSCAALNSCSDKTIKNVNPFFSTTPKRKMADLFVERNREADGERVGTSLQNPPRQGSYAGAMGNVHTDEGGR